MLGEAIRRYRKDAGLSQEKLAEKAELSPVFISLIECGKENISLDAMMRIARALKVTAHELTKGF